MRTFFNNTLQLTLIAPLFLALQANAEEAETQTPASQTAQSFVKKADEFFKPLSLGKEHLVIGGYFQPVYEHHMDTEFNTNDQNGFVFKNARMTGRGKFEVANWFNVEYKFNFDVADGAFLVRDVAGSLLFLNKTIILDIGQFKVPFTLAELTPESDFQFVEAPHLRRVSYGRDRGVQLRGEIPVAGPVWLGYWASAFNGEGQNVSNNTDSKFLYSFRLELAPLGAVSASEPDIEYSDIKFALGGSFAYAPSSARKELGLGDAGAKEIRWAADARLKFKGLSVRGEYLGASVDKTGIEGGAGEGAEKFGRYAFYAQAGYILPWLDAPKFELVFRYSQLDINDAEDGWTTDSQGIRRYNMWDNTEVRRIEFGANAYILDHRLKLSFMYRLSDFLEGPKTDNNGDVLIGDAVMIMLQFGWF